MIVQVPGTRKIQHNRTKHDAAVAAVSQAATSLALDSHERHGAQQKRQHDSTRAGGNKGKK